LGGLSLPQMLTADEGRRRQRPGQAKSVIVLYLPAARRRRDMIDLKPNAASEVRRRVSAIATSAPGPASVRALAAQ